MQTEKKKCTERLWIGNVVCFLCFVAILCIFLYGNNQAHKEKYYTLVAAIIDGTITYAQAHGDAVMMKETYYTTEKLIKLKEHLEEEWNHCMDEQVFEFTFIPGNERYQQPMHEQKDLFRHRCRF